MNNIEESLHNKIYLYLSNKKVKNHNFVISLKNVISNYEILKENLSRHDFFAKDLIYYSIFLK